MGTPGGASGGSGIAPRGGSAPWTGFLIGPLFLVVGGWFLWGPDPVTLPLVEPASVDPAALSTAPRRQVLGDPPIINIDGFERTCMDCHRLFPAQADPPPQLLQHKHVVLDHGINDRCRNCHYEKDRDRLVLRGGDVISYGEVVELCAKCHGPTYRDWQRGAHGRTNGYWDTTRGELKRLKCTECHDPHMPRVPAMDPIRPLPGPRALRAEPQERDHVESGNSRDPLRLETAQPREAAGEDGG